MKKYEGVRALAFVSIISAICLILILLTHFLGGVGLVLMLVLPLCASLVSINVDKKYILIYIVATLLMSSIDFLLALFVVLPSLLSGTLFGILIKKYFHGYYIILINSIFQLILQIASLYLIRLIYDVDMIKTIGILLKLSDIEFHYIFYLFIFMISLIETSLSYLIIHNELKKISFKFNEENNQFIPIIIINTISFIISFILFFYEKSLSFLFLGIYLYFAIILGYYLFSYKKKKPILIIQGILYIISIIGIFVLGSFLKKELYPLLLFILPSSQIITSIIIVIINLIQKNYRFNASLFD